MEKVCVITGGGSGIGFTTAQLLARKDYYVIIVGRTFQKLEAAVNKICREGGRIEAYPCDVCDRGSIYALAQYAASKGEVKAVIHAAAVAPHMASPEKILRCNAIGTVHINDAFFEVMARGGCIINTSSIEAYLLPPYLMPCKWYPMARYNREKFVSKVMRYLKWFPRRKRPRLAYAISKHFVFWFARTDAARFGEKGCRILSVTPGNIATPLGRIQEDLRHANVRYNAIRRFGVPEEIAALYEVLLDERLTYLTGTDILCDGGGVAGGACLKL